MSLCLSASENKQAGARKFGAAASNTQDGSRSCPRCKRCDGFRNQAKQGAQSKRACTVCILTKSAESRCHGLLGKNSGPMRLLGCGLAESLRCKSQTLSCSSLRDMVQSESAAENTILVEVVVLSQGGKKAGKMRKARGEVSKGSVFCRPREAVRVSDHDRRKVHPPHVA